jgi:hypothetical protein
LWKTAKNVTAKSVAFAQPRTYVEARLSTNASSQMSTSWRRPRMARWAIEATVATRTLHRGCQRVVAGSRWCDEPSRQRLRHERFIADVNVSQAGRDGAMSHRDNGCDTDASSRMSTCRERVHDGAMGHRGKHGCRTNASSRMSTCGGRSRWRDEPLRQNGCDTNASSQMSTCCRRSRWRDGPSRHRIRRERSIAVANKLDSVSMTR